MRPALVATQLENHYSAIAFAILAAVMLVTPLLLFAIGCKLNHVLLIDGSGALFGIDVALLMWLREQWQAPLALRVARVPARGRRC